MIWLRIVFFISLSAISANAFVISLDSLRKHIENFPELLMRMHEQKPPVQETSTILTSNERDKYTLTSNNEQMIFRKIGKSICDCKNYTCDCCAHLEVKRVKLNETGCVSLKYLPDELGINVVIKLNDLVLYNDTVSGKYLSRFCLVDFS